MVALIVAAFIAFVVGVLAGGVLTFLALFALLVDRRSSPESDDRRKALSPWPDPARAERGEL